MPLTAAFRRCGLLPLAMMLVQACSDTPGMPSSWGPLRFAADRACPRVYGTYDASDEDFAYIIARRHLPYDSTRGPVESMSLVLDGDSVLTVIAWVDLQPRDTVLLRRGREFGCADGWLKPTFPRWLPSDDGDSPEARSERAGRREFAVATGAKGALVGRLDHHTYDEFTVWCGDGCKGFPIPWTWRTAHHWHRAEQVDPAVTRDRPFVARPMSAIDARLLREEAELEGRVARESSMVSPRRDRRSN